MDNIVEFFTKAHVPGKVAVYWSDELSAVIKVRDVEEDSVAKKDGK